MGCCSFKAKENTNKDDAGNTLYLKRPSLAPQMKGRGSPIVERLDNNMVIRQDYSYINPDEVIVEVNAY